MKYYLYCSIVTLAYLRFSCSELYAQNLIPNGNFEEYSKYKIDERIKDPYYPWTIHLLSHWKNNSWQVTYCNDSIGTTISKKDYNTIGKNDQCKPSEGNGMVQFLYQNHLPRSSDRFIGGQNWGWGAYLTNLLSNPMKIGSIYKFSMKVYLQKNVQNPVNLESHIGVYFSLDPPEEIKNDLMRVPKFFYDTVKVNEWTEVVFYLKAQCSLKYVTIGAFKDDRFPQKHNINNSSHDDYPYYYIDEVSLIELDSNAKLDSFEVTPFCKYYKEFAKRNISESKWTFHFESNKKELLKDDQKKLDAIFQNNPLNATYCYLINGHTDNSGNENELLSQDRAISVKRYLMDKFQIPEFNLFINAYGSNKPISDNNTNVGRKANRRVELVRLNLDVSSAIYRKALMSLNQNDIHTAVSYFNKWLLSVNDERAILFLFDPHNEKLKFHPSYQDLLRKIKQKYSRYNKPDEAFYLDSIYCLDQKYRTLCFDLKENMGYVGTDDTLYKCSYNLNMDYLEIYDAQVKKLAFPKENNNIIFPKIRDVGSRAVQGLIYILSHSNDTLFIEKYLPLIEQNCMIGESYWHNYALLYDKILMLKNLPQLYGTQYTFIDKEKRKLKLYPVLDLDETNRLRSNFGMGIITNSDEIYYLREVKE